MQQNLPNRENCTGCAACYNSCAHGAITMQEDKDGFLIPIVNESKCIDCNLCTKKCPVINIPQFEETHKKIYAAYNLNKEQHQKSASGGLFSAFANYFYQLENGVVCASAFDENLNLKIKTSTCKEDLKQLRGSKYVQSEPGQIYKNIRKLLLEDKQVFFLGTPCQVAGLRSYLGKECQNLFTIDLVCHGVPSPRLFKSYLKAIGVSDKQEYENYYFRNQNNSVYFTNSVKPKDGRSWDIPREKHSYICAYLKGWIHRESCYNCHFTGEHRQGDCTICDFWGILSGKTPFEGKVSMGVSMVMTNTEKGKAMFDKIKNQLYFEEKSYEDAIIDNHNLIRPDARPKERDFIYNELIKLSPCDFMRKYGCRLYVPIPIWKRVINKMKSILLKNK